MIQYNYTSPLGLTSQFSFCGLPLRLDTYAGCALSCTYCFARLRGGGAETKKIRFADPNVIITKFKSSLNRPDITTGVVSELIRANQPLHFGGMSDPFQPIEERMEISLKVLKFLCSIKYPLVISTKSTLVAEPQYLDVLKSNPNVVVQFSFSTTRDELGQLIEPHSFSPSEILKTIETLSKSGVKTTARWQPYIPSISEEPTEFIGRVSSVGIKHLGFEHLKLPVEKNSPLWIKLLLNLDFDIKKYYKANGCINDGREFVLPAHFKINKALEIKRELSKFSISFGSADNDIQYLSDTDCCCSGVDQFVGFENWNRFQIAHAVKKSNGNLITYDLISEEWRPKGSIDKYLNSKSRIQRQSGFNKIEDYIEERWEDLNSDFNPTKFYGVIYKGLRDTNGKRIFEWDKTLINNF